MLSFHDPTIRTAAAFRHLICNGRSNAGAVRTELEKTQRNSDEQRFLLTALVQDAMTSIDKDDTIANGTKQLLRMELEKALNAPNYVGLVADVFDGYEKPLTAENVNTLLNAKEVHLRAKDKIAFLIAMCYAAESQHRVLGKKLLLERLGVEAGSKELLSKAKINEIESLLESDHLIQQLAALIGSEPRLAVAAGFTDSTAMKSFIPKKATEKEDVFDSLEDLAASSAASMSLAGLMSELGPNAISTPTEAKRFISLYTSMGCTLTPKVVGECISFIINASAATAAAKAAGTAWSNLKTASNNVPKWSNEKDESDNTVSTGTTPWNTPNFVTAVKEAAPSLDWNLIMQSLDNKYLGTLEQREKFAIALGAYKKATGNNAPLRCFLTPMWEQNPGAQLNVIRYLIANPDLVDRTATSSGHSPNTPSVAQSSKDDSNVKLPDTLISDLKPSQDFSALWRYPAVVGTLIDLAAASPKCHAEVATLFTTASRACAAGTVASICCARPRRSWVAVKFLLQILADRSPAQCIVDSVLSHVCSSGYKTVLVAALSRYVSNDHARIASILPMLQKHNLSEVFLRTTTDALVYVTVCISSQETKELAPNYLADILGRGRSTINAAGIGNMTPGSWAAALATSIVEVADDMLNKQAIAAMSSSSSGSPVGSSKQADAAAAAAAEAAAIPTGPIRNALIAVCEAADLGRLMPKTVAYAESLLARGGDIMRAAAEEAEGSNDSDSATTALKAPPASPAGGFTKDMERQAQDFIDALKRHKDAAAAVESCKGYLANEKTQQLLNCIVFLTLQETKCLNQYPQKELSTFAHFFGGLVLENLMNTRDLQQALRVVLQAVSKPQDIRVSEFGNTALSCFKQRVPSWPIFASELRQIGDIDMKVPGLVAVLDRAEREAAIKNGSGFGNSHLSEIGVSPGVSSPLQRGFVTAVPSSVVQDRINFVVGNTDPSNMEVNAAELKQLVQTEHYNYFAQYLVVKRIALEPNNHKMYLGLIDRVEQPELDAALRKATIFVCRRLLESDKIRTNSSERTLLKNLGSFLGQITLARNIPILALDLDLRELVPKALVAGKLIAVVPFIAKVLEHSAASAAFRVPSPWLMGLLAQLCEMYQLPDLKITLRFEVEVLCRNLGTSITEVADAVKNRMPYTHRATLAELKAQHVDVRDSPDFRLPVNTDPTVEMNEPVPVPQPGPVPPPPGQPGPNPNFTPTLRVRDDLQPSLTRLGVIPLLQSSMERAISDLMPPLERSVTISCTTTKEIVCKDFHWDPDENKARHAALGMARCLAANLVAVTARDLLPNTLRKQLQGALAQTMSTELMSAEVLDALVQDNVESCSQRLDNITSETVAKTIEEMLTPFCDMRRKARARNEYFTPPLDLQKPSVQEVIKSLPDPLKQLGPVHLNLYKEFQNLMPGDSSVEQVIQLMQVIQDAANAHYLQVPPTTPQHVLSLTNVAFTETTASKHHNLIKEKLISVSHLITEANSVPLLNAMFPRIVQLAEKVQVDLRPVGNHNHCVNLLLNEVCLFVLQAVREKGGTRAISELTRMYLAHERRWYNKDLATNLVRLRVVDITEFDRLLNQALATDSNNRIAVEFAGHIVQKCLIDDKLATVKDLKHTLEILEKIAGQSKKKVPSRVRVPSQHGPEQRDQVNELFKEWMGICEQAAKNTSTQSNQERQQISLMYVQKLQQSGMLKVESMLDKFFGLLIELSVEYYATEAMKLEREGIKGNHGPNPEPGRGQCPPPPSRFPHEPKLFTAVDAYTDLVIVLVKCCSWSRRPEEGQDKTRQSHAEVALVTKVLSVVAKALQYNHDYFAKAETTPPPPLPDGHIWQKEHMQQPFFRFFSNLLIALGQSQEEAVGTSADVFPVMASTFHAINPMRLPSFAFAWVELICHRVFIVKTLKHANPIGWQAYFKLINDALRFIDPFARSSEMTQALSLFFKCILKEMLLLLHDFPEFLLAYHQPLCDAIPLCCVQLRNVVLSAFPRNTKLPDPFNSTMKIDQLPEVQQSPSLIPSVKEFFTNEKGEKLALGGQPNPFEKAEFDSYIVTKKPTHFPETVIAKLRKPGSNNYNIPLLNGTVLYACIAGIEAQGSVKSDAAEGEAATKAISFNPDSGAVELIKEMFQLVDNEGRYLLVNACANQLRFPNSHTHFFSSLLLHIFNLKCNLQEQIQEVITRVLAERLIITRPHPWGLLITFIEIVKNPKYEFWDKPFIRCTPEIENMFESVGKSVANSNGNAAAAANSGGASANPNANAAGAVSAPNK